MIDNISILVGLKNNLSYSKYFYQTTRELYPQVEICFVSYDSQDHTNEWLDSILTNDPNIRIFYENNKDKGFSDSYNKAAEIATKEYILFAHNDIVLSKNFLENISKHLSPDNIVSYTRIEPPIFDDGLGSGKIIYDCGIGLRDFDKNKFVKHAELLESDNNNQIEDDISFFMCIHRKLFLDIGGFDNLFFPFFAEDDDLIKRLKMIENKKYFTIKDAISYHFVSKTSRFSDEYVETSKTIELRNKRNYLRKWGSLKYEKTYPVTLVIKNPDIYAIYALEPYGQKLYIASLETNLIEQYIDLEQKNTKINLKNKLCSIDDFNPNLCKNICLIDCDNFDEYDLKNIENIQQIISKIGKPYFNQVHNLVFLINSLDTIHKNSIINSRV